MTEDRLLYTIKIKEYDYNEKKRWLAIITFNFMREEWTNSFNEESLRKLLERLVGELTPIVRLSE